MTLEQILKQATVEELNSNENGSCNALEALVSRGSFFWGYNPDQQRKEEDDTLKAIDALLQAGAKWLPSKNAMRYIRKRLCERDPRYVVQVIRMLLYTPGATTVGSIWELCRTDLLRGKIQSADHELWNELLELAIKEGLTKNASHTLRKRTAY